MTIATVHIWKTVFGHPFCSIWHFNVLLCRMMKLLLHGWMMKASELQFMRNRYDICSMAVSKNPIWINPKISTNLLFFVGNWINKMARRPEKLNWIVGTVYRKNRLHSWYWNDGALSQEIHSLGISRSNLQVTKPINPVIWECQKEVVCRVYVPLGLEHILNILKISHLGLRTKKQRFHILFAEFRIFNSKQRRWI